MTLLYHLMFSHHRLSEIDEDNEALEGDENEFIYNIVLLFFYFLGIIFNWLSLLILADKEHKLPIFTYLSVYTCMDLLYTIILFADVLIRQYFRCRTVLGISGLLELFFTEVINTVRVIAILAITLDRLHHLKRILDLRSPGKIKTQYQARLVMVITFLFALIGNLPNMLIYSCPNFCPNSEYLQSGFYSCYNWVYFPVFYVIPCLLMIIGNVRLTILLRKAVSREKIRCKNGRKINFTLTIAATIIIMIFVVVQMPGYFIEKIHFISMLPHQIHKKIGEVLDTINRVYRFIPAVNSFANFFIYILFCPPFKRALVKTLLEKKRKCRTRSSTINHVEK